MPTLKRFDGTAFEAPARPERLQYSNAGAFETGVFYRYEDGTGFEQIHPLSLLTPTGLTATLDAVFPESRVDLQWTVPCTTIRQWEIHKSVTSGFTPGAGTLHATVTAIDPSGSGHTESYEVQGLSDETTWYFKVLGKTGTVLSAASAQASATTDPAKPGTVANITIVARNGYDDYVTVDFDPATDADDYDIYLALAAMGADPTATGTLYTPRPTNANPVDIDVATLISAGADDEVFVNVRARNNPGPVLGDWGTEASAYTHRETPGITVTAEDLTNCPTEVGITLTVDHLNTDSQDRTEAFKSEYRTAATQAGLASAAWGSQASHAASTTSVTRLLGTAGPTWVQARVKYGSESVWTEGGKLEVQCPI